MAETAFDPAPLLRQLSTRPGVYRMLDADGEVLYVGKARNLKKRVSSYFLRASGNPRIEQMVARVRGIEVTVTPSEDEALLLECNLIKSLQPRYNVLLRDDKSYPYIRITRSHPYPRLMFHRGAQPGKDLLFGPYPSAATVRETLSVLQRLFRLRPCSDAYFANRSRPCLQYQIRRCSAPCVAKIDETAYAADVQRAVALLRGRGEKLMEELAQRMERQSAELEFEQAAETRDRIAMLRRIQEQRVVTGARGDFDVVAVGERGGISGALVMSVRNGRNLGHRSLFPRVPAGLSSAELMAAFVGQYYTAHDPPPELIVSEMPEDDAWLAAALTHRSGVRVAILQRVRGTRRKLLEMAGRNLELALEARLLSRSGAGRRLAALQALLDLDAPPQRMECFDISHSHGEAPVASCVVFEDGAPHPADYRRFNIRGVTPGDDYAAIGQAVSRRYKRLKGGEFPLPDVLFIDGGAGQLGAAQQALDALELPTQPLLIAVAKGSARRAGLEQVLVAGQQQPLRLPGDDPALHLIQQIRDESHRFAITGHRGRRAKVRTASVLDEIPGLGPRRRASLLRQFGGMRQLERAALEDLARVPGFSRKLARRVYDHLHEH